MDYSKLKTVYQYLTIGTRKNGDNYYHFKEETPETIKNWFQDITGKHDNHNFNALEEYYAVLYRLAETVADYEEFTENDFYNMDWRDIYNYELLDWLKEDLSRAYLYDEIKDNGAEGIFALIGDMQEMYRHNFAQYIVDHLDELDMK